MKFGRPKRELPSNFEEVLFLWEEGKISLRGGAKLLDTNHTMFSKWIKKYYEKIKKKGIDIWTKI